jgi:hypothetical protein
MHDARRTAIAETRRLLDEARQLRDRLRTCETTYRRSLRELERGAAIRTVLNNAEVGDVRQSLNDALQQFEQTRHRSRLAIIASGLQEGMTIGELGRSWRFSRQLASRYAKEARSES